MKRLLTYLFLVLGLGLIFSGSTFAKEKAYFCSKKEKYIKSPIISSTPCNKTLAGYGKWHKISAKKYIIGVINTYGLDDTVIKSLYDDFERHNLDTNIIEKVIKKKRKTKKPVIDKKKRCCGI